MDTTKLFEHLQVTTGKVLKQYPSAELVILGDFNAHHVEWLGSRSTDYAGRSAQDFALAGLWSFTTGIISYENTGCGGSY